MIVGIVWTWTMKNNQTMEQADAMTDGTMLFQSFGLS